MIEHAETQKRHEAIHRRDQQEARLAKIRQKEERAKARFESGEPPYKRQVSEVSLIHRAESDSRTRKQTLIRKPQMLMRKRRFY